MARKRYETAFIPASSTPTNYPDVDSLLFSIDCCALTNSSRRKTDLKNNSEEYCINRTNPLNKNISNENVLIENDTYKSKSIIINEGKVHKHDNMNKCYSENNSITNESTIITPFGPIISNLTYHQDEKKSLQEDILQGRSSTSIRDKRLIKQGRSRSFTSYCLGTLSSKANTNTNIKNIRSISPSPNMPMPISLSEQLRPKNYCKTKCSYSSIQSSSSGCSTTSSNSPIQNSSSERISRKSPSASTSPSLSTNTTINLVPESKKSNIFKLIKKGNSTSSLESIDSSKSDDFKYIVKQQINSKLLSPISDKSPVEPNLIVQSSSLTHHHHYHHNSPQNGNINCGFGNKFELKTSCENNDTSYGNTKENGSRRSLQGSTSFALTEEYTNVPWEMPKLKRKLALLVDSGISLDIQGSIKDNLSISSINQKNDVEESQLKGTNSNIKSAHNLKESYHKTILNDKNQSIERNKTCTTIYSDTKDNDANDSTEKVLIESDSKSTMTTSHEEHDSTLSDIEHLTPPPLPPPLLKKPTLFKPDRCKMKLDFSESSQKKFNRSSHNLIDAKIDLEGQPWFHGVLTRIESETVLRNTKEGSFLVRHCESSTFNSYSLSIKSSRGFIHVRIQPKLSSGNFTLGDDSIEFESVPSLVLHFMSHRFPIKGTEHVLLKYPVIINLL